MDEKPQAQTPATQSWWHDLPLLWQEVRKRARNFAETNRMLGQQHLAAGQWQDAVFRFWVVSKLKPDEAAPWAQLAEAYIGLRKPEKARAALEKALSLAPQDAALLALKQRLNTITETRDAAA